MDTGLYWTVPDPALRSTPHGRPDAFVPGRNPGGPGRSAGRPHQTAPPDGHPGAVGHRALRPTQRGVAAHLPGTAAQDPLARHAGAGLCAAACGPVRGGLSGPGAEHLCPDLRPDGAHRRPECARLPRPGSGAGPPTSAAPGPRPAAWCWPRRWWTASPTQARSCCACRAWKAA